MTRATAIAAKRTFAKGKPLAAKGSTSDIAGSRPLALASCHALLHRRSEALHGNAGRPELAAQCHHDEGVFRIARSE